MPPIEPPTRSCAAAPGELSGLAALCVSIHDVAPATWKECERLAAAIREVADIPLTWLVVPHYHCADERDGDQGGDRSSDRSSDGSSDGSSDAAAARVSGRTGERPGHRTGNPPHHRLSEPGGGPVGDTAGVPTDLAPGVRTGTQTGAQTGVQSGVQTGGSIDERYTGRPADVEPSQAVAPSNAMEAGLGEQLARGDELCLHGYTHLDTSPPGDGWRDRFLRGTYSREGEFAALAEDEAERRIRLGLAWFAARGWPASGFVPPAWLMGEGAWRALRRFTFAYTTTFTRFHLLRDGRPCMAPFSPSLVYAARNRSGRLSSPLLADATAAVLARAPLIRLSLHPPDVRHPRLLHHAQRTVERLLAKRQPMTKAAFARQLTSMVPSNPRPANSAVPSLRNTMECCQADGARPWC